MLREIVTVAVAVGASVLVCACAAGAPAASAPHESAVALPPPRTVGDRSLEEALAARRSVREFADRPVDANLVAQLLWSAQGVTSVGGGRTAPSAGALYPIEVYVVEADGAGRYLPDEHALVPVDRVDAHDRLGEAAGQDAMRSAPVVFVITGVEARTADRYGDRAERYVWLEAGHVAQNLLLQAVALGLGAVPVGSFDDDAVRDALDLPDGEDPLYLVPVGHSAG